MRCHPSGLEPLPPYPDYYLPVQASSPSLAWVGRRTDFIALETLSLKRCQRSCCFQFLYSHHRPPQEKILKGPPHALKAPQRELSIQGSSRCGTSGGVSEECSVFTWFQGRLMDVVSAKPTYLLIIIPSFLRVQKIPRRCGKADFPRSIQCKKSRGNDFLLLI